MPTEPIFADWKEAARLSGSPSPQAARRWVNRWNARRPDVAILRRRGRVELASFKRALAEDAAQFSASMRRVVEAAAAATASRRPA
jgi:hypothetical protein